MNVLCVESNVNVLLVQSIVRAGRSQLMADDMSVQWVEAYHLRSIID